MAGNAIGMVLGLMLAFTSPTLVQDGDEPNTFTFASKEIGPWSLRATSQVTWSTESGAHPPKVVGVFCDAQSDDVRFRMNSDKSIVYFRPTFHGPPDKAGSRSEITLLGDHLWLYIDGQRWEFANISTDSPSALNKSDGLVIADWHGYKAVRKTDRDLWADISTISSDILRAHTVKLAFKSRDWSVVDKSIPDNRLPDQWETTRYRVEIAKSRDVIAWCSRQVSSHAAHVLPARFR